MKRALTTLITAATLAATGLITAAPANAASVCAKSPNFCDGLDPARTDCDNDRVMLEKEPIRNGANKTLGYVQLRWSANCQSNWAHASTTTGGPDRSFAVVIYRQERDGQIYTKTGSGRGQFVWSPLLYGRGLCTWAGALVLEGGKFVAAGYTEKRCG